MIKLPEVLVLRFSPIEQENVPLVSLVSNAEENEQLDKKDAHIEKECHHNRLDLWVKFHLCLVSQKRFPDVLKICRVVDFYSNKF